MVGRSLSDNIGGPSFWVENFEVSFDRYLDFLFNVSKFLRLNDEFLQQTILRNLIEEDFKYINQRLHQSLPALDVEAVPDDRKKVDRKKAWQQKGDDALSFIVSAIYAKVLVILGMALPITQAVATQRPHASYDGYFLYLYIGSILFLLYMYTIHMKNKTRDDNGAAISARQCGPHKCWRMNHHVRYGNLYFRMGVTGFGIGSVIGAGLQFGQYFEFSDKGDCGHIFKAVKPISRIVFTLLQMLFIFSYSNLVNVHRSRIIARFGLMHMIATNLCEWTFVILEETQSDIYKSAEMNQGRIIRRNMTSLYNSDSKFLNSSAFHITKYIYDHKIRCLSTHIMERILTNMQQYLASCTVDYSLLCAVILVLIWKNSHTYDSDNIEDISRDIKAKQSGCNVIYSRHQDQFSVDCAQAQRGLFLGILSLAITIISLIMFFELLNYDKYEEIAILQVNICEAILFWGCTIATIACIWTLRDVGNRTVDKSLELEHLLLLVTQTGVFIYSFFQIIGVFLMGLNKERGNIMRILSPLSALIQSSLQTALVLDARRRQCSTLDQMRKKPGRQHITFLLAANVSLWVVNRLKNTRAISHPNQMDVYGILAWNIITHVSMPLVVSYRFQSTVCFYEIWKHVYKTKPFNRSVNGCV